MKNNLLKLYILGLVLFSDFLMFAQPNDESNDPSNPVEGDDAPQAPINGKLLWLALLGVLFALHVYRNNCKVKA